MIRNTDRDSYGSEALRIPSMELLFIFVFWSGHGQVLSVTNGSHISNRMSPIFKFQLSMHERCGERSGWRVPVKQGQPECCYLQCAG